jgi:hypothetical protein
MIVEKVVWDIESNIYVDMFAIKSNAISFVIYYANKNVILFLNAMNVYVKMNAITVLHRKNIRNAKYRLKNAIVVNSINIILKVVDINVIRKSYNVFTYVIKFVIKKNV